MENLTQFNQFPMELDNDYNPEYSSHCDYMQLQTPRELECNINDSGRIPLIPIPSTSLSSMDWTNSYPNQDFDLDHMAHEWSETRFDFDHDWADMEIANIDLNPAMAQTQVYSPSQMFWPLDDLQTDNMFNSISPPAVLPPKCYPAQMLLASRTYPTPESSTASANSNQFDYYDGSNESSETSRAPLKALSKPSYICETCGVEYSRRHLLNDHSKIHNPSLVCPVQGCTHRAAKSRDMERHLRTEKHKDYAKGQAPPALSRSVCPVPDCKNGRRGFARKDHLLRHLKKFHLDWGPKG